MSTTRWQGHSANIELRRAAWLDSITPSTGRRSALDIEALPVEEPITLTTIHQTIVAADIDGFGDQRRTNTNQVRIRRGLYAAVRYAFGAADIPWSSCYREDRGDGLLVLASADARKSLFVDRLPDILAAALANHNKAHPAQEQIRLRLALHAGEVNFDDYGVTSAAITSAFRLVSARKVKEEQARSSAVLAIVASAWFFDEVIRHSEQSHASLYQAATIKNKEAVMSAWIRLLV
jgi:hypothetical protein